MAMLHHHYQESLEPDSETVQSLAVPQACLATVVAADIRKREEDIEKFVVVVVVAVLLELVAIEQQYRALVAVVAVAEQTGHILEEEQIRVEQKSHRELEMVVVA